MNTDKDFYGILIGKNRRKNIFWRDIIFSDVETARFYIDQEAFAYSIDKVKNKLIPSRYSIELIGQWEISENEDKFKVFELPKKSLIYMSDSDIDNIVMIDLSLNDNNTDNIYYTGVVGFMGNVDYNKIVDDHFKDGLLKTNSLLFGIKVRPAIYDPTKRNLISMSGSGVPGLWYANFGVPV